MKKNMKLYAVTDHTWLKEKKLSEVVLEALEGGVTFVQLRNKHAKDDELLKEALELKAICNSYQVPFVINDRVDIAITSNADGVHLGQNDMTINDARKELGPNKIIGVTVKTVDQALEAERNGADYLGVGAAFSTSTKLDAIQIDHKVLKEICQVTTCPVVAIGGINESNIEVLSNTEIDGVAVVSALFSKEDIKKTAKHLSNLVEKHLGCEL